MPRAASRNSSRTGRTCCRVCSPPLRARCRAPAPGVDRIELWNTFNIVLRRLAEKLVVGEIHDEVVTVSDQMEWLLGRVAPGSTCVFTSLFPEGVTLRRLVATFLAMLELTRIKRLRIRQNEAFTDIFLDGLADTSEAPVVVTAGTTEENLLETTGIPPTVTS